MTKPNRNNRFLELTISLLTLLGVLSACGSSLESASTTAAVTPVVNMPATSTEISLATNVPSAEENEEILEPSALAQPTNSFDTQSVQVAAGDATSSDSGNAPSDIQEHIAWYFGGFGGGGGCPIPSLSELNIQLDRVMGVVDVELESGHMYTLTVCNLAPTKSLVLTLPDGSNIVASDPPLNIATWCNDCKQLEYSFGPDSLFGIYTVALIDGGSVSIIDRFDVGMPEFPIGAWYLSDNADLDHGIVKGNAWFVGYEPHESVRLLIYVAREEQRFETELFFLEERFVEADEKGTLWIQGDNIETDIDIVFIAVGEKSGAAIATRMALGYLHGYCSYQQIIDAILTEHDEDLMIYDVSHTVVEDAAGGPLVLLDVCFRDSDGDAKLLDWSLVSSDLTGVQVEDDPIDISSERQQSGTTANGVWQCGKATYSVTLEVAVVDRQGNRSNTVEHHFSCGGD